MTIQKKHSDIAINESEKYSFFKNARDIGFVIAVHLYLSGWVYVYYYLKEFGISIRQLDIDFYNLITYSIDVIWYLVNSINNKFNHHPTIFCIIIVFALLFFLFYTIYKNKMDRSLTKFRQSHFFFMIKYFFLLGAFIASYWIGKKAAFYNKNRDQLKATTQLHRINFVFKKTEIKNLQKPSKIDQDSTDLLKYNNDGELRLLIADKETYYVYRFDPTQTSEDTGAGVYDVFLIQRENIDYAKISN